jgi:hypothetical protein
VSRGFGAPGSSADAPSPAPRGDKFFNLSNADCQGPGEVPPMPRRRTFATDIVSVALSDADFAAPSWLRSSSYAGSRGIDGPSPTRMGSSRSRPSRPREAGGPGLHLCRPVERPRRQEGDAQHQRAEARRGKTTGCRVSCEAAHQALSGRPARAGSDGCRRRPPWRSPAAAPAVRDHPVRRVARGR